jgi:hypothetical protein
VGRARERLPRGIQPGVFRRELFGELRKVKAAFDPITASTRVKFARQKADAPMLRWMR